MECLNCETEYDEDYQDECPVCGYSVNTIICPECEFPVDENNLCNCGKTLEDFDDEEEDEEDEEYDYYDYMNADDDDDDEIDPGNSICENCSHWITHRLGSAYGMICQMTGENTDPDDYCSSFSQMFHFSNYGDEGQYSFIDTDQEKKRKLDNWRNRRY